LADASDRERIDDLERRLDRLYEMLACTAALTSSYVGADRAEELPAPP
jgi:hypothetical protein